MIRPPPISTFFPSTPLFRFIARLHIHDFPRLRIGIGRPFRNRPAPANYLLSPPSTEDRILLEAAEDRAVEAIPLIDRKSTRLNSSHLVISYAVFCLKKKTKN